MASAFQKTKLMHLFNTFYDYNGDGVIEWIDFDSLIDTVCKIHGWEKSSKQAQDNLLTLKEVWEGLQAKADADKNNQITPQEWFTMWNDCYTNKDLPAWQNKYCDFFFNITDTSGDGIVDEEEYTAVFGKDAEGKGFGFSPAECHEAFNAISNNGANPVNRDAYHKLWTEFVMSDDEKAPGNKLFGPIGKKA